MISEQAIKARLDDILEQTKKLNATTHIDKIRANSKLMSELENILYQKIVYVEKETAKETIVITKKEEISIPNVVM